MAIKEVHQNFNWALPWLKEIGGCQMVMRERLVLWGLLNAIRPEVSLEIGTAEGGSLAAIAPASGTVHCFDRDETMSDRLAAQYPNARFHVGLTQDTVPAVVDEMNRSDAKVGFVLIDGDHTTEGARSDCNAVLQLVPRVPIWILMHDCFHPVTRNGYLTASWENSPYVQGFGLDFVPGELVPNNNPAFPGQLWGGFAFALMTPEKRQGPLIVEESSAAHSALFPRSVHMPPPEPAPEPPPPAPFVKRMARRVKRSMSALLSDEK